MSADRKSDVPSSSGGPPARETTPTAGQSRFGSPSGPTGGWRRRVRLLLFGLGLVISLVAVLGFQFLPSVASRFREGDVSTGDIKSPSKVSYISQIKTEEERNRVEAGVPAVVRLDPTVATRQRQELMALTQRIDEIRRSASTIAGKRDALAKLEGVKLPDLVIDDLLAFDIPTWRAVVSDTLRVLDEVMADSISSEQVDQAKTRVDSLVSSGLDPRQTAVVGLLAKSLVRANTALDTEATARAKRQARESVPPVRVTIEKGETILRDGEIVTPWHLERLEAAGLLRPTVEWTDILRIFLLVAVLVSLLTFYVSFFQPNVAADERRLLLLGLVVLVAMLAAKLTIPDRDIYAYLFPTAAVAMLVATLLDAHLAIVVTAIVSLMIGSIAKNPLELTVLGIVGGLVALLGVRRLERMNTFSVTGLLVAAANFVVIITFQLGSSLELARVGLLAFVSVVNGALAAALTLGTFSVLGHIFGITTILGLLELAHPSHPLFRRLLTDAPGTYHHSAVVANLAEQAAQQIGADALLARVGAYYHDIGKVVHPYAFIENQLDGHNIHDQLDPKSSAQIIAAHVREGLELARRYSLPRRVRDMIPQHHGTGLVTYFYRRACQDTGAEMVNEDDYRYPGPRPQTREAAIMMLADSAEATIRASNDRSLENIEHIVNEVIDQRLTEGQLDDSDLTLRDLHRIRTAFINVLQGTYHPRIEYPKALPISASKVKG